MRQLHRLLAVAAMAAVAPACAWPGAGEMNDPPPDITLRFVNDSPRALYVFRVDARSDVSSLASEQFIWRVDPGTSVELGADSGSAAGARTCLANVQFWVVASRSGTTYPEGVTVFPAGDVQIVRHIEPRSCFDTDDVTIGL